MADINEYIHTYKVSGCLQQNVKWSIVFPIPDLAVNLVVMDTKDFHLKRSRVTLFTLPSIENTKVRLISSWYSIHRIYRWNLLYRIKSDHHDDHFIYSSSGHRIITDCKKNYWSLIIYRKSKWRIQDK